jgi:hypothetical protein
MRTLFVQPGKVNILQSRPLRWRCKTYLEARKFFECFLLCSGLKETVDGRVAKNSLLTLDVEVPIFSSQQLIAAKIFFAILPGRCPRTSRRASHLREAVFAQVAAEFFLPMAVHIGTSGWSYNY